MWLLRDMLYSTKSTIFRKFIIFSSMTKSLRGPRFGDPDLANKLRIFQLVANFTNHAKCVFSWAAWAVYGLALATEGSRQNHMSLVTVARCVNRGAIGAVPSIELLSKNCHDRVQPPSLVFCWSFCVRADCWVSTMVCCGASCYHFVVIQWYTGLSPLSEMLQNCIVRS